MSDPEQNVSNRPKAEAGFAPMNGSVTALDGYRAAGLLIERMLDEAERKRPKRIPNRKSAAYRAGIYDAILVAHCWMAFGEFPRRNEAEILKAMKSLNESS